jgi:hypothetical protein
LLDRPGQGRPERSEEKSWNSSQVQHAFKFLKPGGKLYAIMSPGVRFRQLQHQGGLRGVRGTARADSESTALPECTFAKSVTNVKTVIVELTNPAA